MTGLDTGSVMIRFESGGEETPEVTIRILKSKNIYYLDQSIGWLYFVLWSVSFYPQVKIFYLSLVICSPIFGGRSLRLVAPPIDSEYLKNYSFPGCYEFSKKVSCWIQL